MRLSALILCVIVAATVASRNLSLQLDNQLRLWIERELGRRWFASRQDLRSPNIRPTATRSLRHSG